MSILNKGNLKVWRHIINRFLIKYIFIICTSNTGYTGWAGCTGCNNLKNYLRLILKVHTYIIKKINIFVSKIYKYI